MNHLESKNRTQLYHFLTTDCKIKVSLGNRRETSKSQKLGVFNQGCGSYQSVLLRLPFKRESVAYCPQLLHLKNPSQFRVEVTLLTASGSRQRTARVLEPEHSCPVGNSVYRQPLPFGSPPAWLRLSQGCTAN